MSNYKPETKSVQSGYQPGTEKQESSRFIRVRHSVIQAVSRWDVCLIWKNLDLRHQITES